MIFKRASTVSISISAENMKGYKLYKGVWIYFNPLHLECELSQGAVNQLFNSGGGNR